MIETFYKFTLPRFINSTNIIFKILNGISIGEYYLVNALCDKYVKKTYPKCRKELNKAHRKEKIIISLTTIPSRINNIPYVLRSVFNQTLMPDRVVLWISDKIELEERDGISKLLQTYIAQGLEVRYVKDVRVHTKYYYSIKENPEDVIITIDDDMIYSENLVERLYNKHLEFPAAVIAGRAHEITYKNNEILPYSLWHRLAPGIDFRAKCLLATGVGGVLYPPHCLYHDWDNISLFLELCPTADDIWLKIMESLAHTEVIKLYKFTREIFTFSNTQDVALVKTNVGEGKNDILLRKCQNYYKFTADLFSYSKLGRSKN